MRAPSESGAVPGAPNVSSNNVSPVGASIVRSRLFIKYVILLIGVVSLALIANGAFEVYFSYLEQTASLIRIQREQAEASAGKIEQFISEIESQVGWTTQLPWSAGTLEQRRFDALRLLRQVPAITELAEIDSSGHEQLKVSRLAMEVVGSGNDVSKDAAFREAVAHKAYYGPVYFRRESEPYMTLSFAGTRRETGVSIAQVNLKLIWDVLSKIKFAGHGRAYVVDGAGRLIAHPDISLVLRNTDMSQLPQVQRARAATAADTAELVQEAVDTEGHPVLTASAPVSPLGWHVFVETPMEEIYAPLYGAFERTAFVLLGALALAFAAGLFLARRMVVPIQALRAGAARLGSGDLGQRISIKTGDEIEALADQFNEMAGRLQESYTNLEQKVDARTHELSEALEQQTATSEVLRVISSSPGNLEPVFASMLEKAVAICGAKFGNIYRWENTGLHLVATYNTPPAFADARRYSAFKQPGPLTVTGRMLATKAVVHVADAALQPGYCDKSDPAAAAAVELGGARTILAVPMIREAELIGSFTVYRQEVRPFTDKQITLVESFAAQAVIAVENARLLNELRQRTDDLGHSVGELRALGEVSQAVNSTLDLETVLSTIVAKAVQLSNTEAGALYVFDDRDREFHLRTTYGMDLESIEALRNARLDFGDRNVELILAEREPIQVGDLQQEIHSDVDRIIVRAGYRSRLTAPLFRGDDLAGLLVVRRRTPGAFARSTVDLVKTFAAQSAVAIQNARLFENVEMRTRELVRSLQDLRTAQDRLVQTEKLASLGQLTAGIAHEIKNPLNFVNNFSSLSVDLLDELQDLLQTVAVEAKTRNDIAELSGMLRGNLERVVHHGKRADSIVKNMLLHSRQGSGEHEPVDINALVEESLNLAYHGARAERQDFNITLERSFDPAAGKVDLFPQELTRVLLNLIANGFYATTKRKGVAGGGYEPKLTVATQSLGDSVEIRIRDNGTGIPSEVREKMFNPFFTTKPAGEGTGLGLSLSHDIVVKQHAGSIQVDTKPGEFTEFRIVLPRAATSVAKSGGSA
jgi:signal transduction histidine kinase